MSEKVRRTVLVILLILDVIMLFAWIISSALEAPALGSVIDELYLKNVRYERILHYVSGYGMFVFLFMTIATVVFAVAERLENVKKAYATAGVMCLTGIVMLVMMLSKCLPAMTTEALVIKGSVTDTRYRYHKGNHSYYLEFGAYGEIGVPEIEYRGTDIGDEYYLICCGDLMIKACHPALYTLEVPAANNSGNRR